MRARAATLGDVAKLAGLSKGTASLALNGRPVNEKTRELVLSCARKLNYVPNGIGRTLSTGKSMTVQLLIINTRYYVDMVKEISFFYHMLEGILTVVEQHQYSLHFDVKHWEDEGLLQYFNRKVRDRTIDGMIIIPQFVRDYVFLQTLKEQGMPYIMLNPCAQNQDVNNLTVNNYLGGRLVAELFIRRGFSRISLINGPKDHFDAVERKRGFLDVLREKGINLQKQNIRYGDFTRKSGYRMMKEILNSSTPEGVFCANDYMAAGAMQSIYESGLRIPDDVSVTGYDNIDVALAVYPPLTTVDNCVFESGVNLAQGLFRLIEKSKRSVDLPIKPSLILRGSC